MIVNIIGENFIHINEKEYISVEEIYRRVEKFYKFIDIKNRLLITPPYDELSEEEIDNIAEKIIERADDKIYNSGEYFDSYWSCIDEAISDYTKASIEKRINGR